MSRWYDYFTCTLSWRMVGKSYLYHRYHNYILVQTHTHTHTHKYIYISSSILVTFPTLYFFFKRKVWKRFVQLSFRCTYYILKVLLLFLPWQVDQNHSHINVQMKKQQFWGCTTLYLHFPKNYKDWIFFYNGMIYQARSTSVCCYIWYCHEGEDHVMVFEVTSPCSQCSPIRWPLTTRCRNLEYRNMNLPPWRLCQSASPKRLVYSCQATCCCKSEHLNVDKKFN